MTQAYGLYGHIQANRIRSVVLLLGFVVLLQMLNFSLFLLWAAFAGSGQPLDRILWAAFDRFLTGWPYAMAIAAVWFAIAWVTHHLIIRSATGARPVERREAPELYNLLENLCVSRGLAMPRLEIIESPALNAYAAGMREGDYVIAVTRGLIDTLDRHEIEAVLAHELTHIRNKDTQMMVIAIIFAGIFAFIGDMIFRGWDFPYGVYPRDRHSRGRDQAGSDERSSGGSSGSGGAVIAIVIALAIIAITWGVSTIIRFALSRSREYLADAGAVELTKNPDAMISALQKISQNPNVATLSRMEAFYIENPLPASATSWFSTHPATSDRIDALMRYAGGHLDAPAPA